MAMETVKDNHSSGENVTVQMLAAKAAKVSLAIALLITAALFIFTNTMIAAGHAAGVAVGRLNLFLLYRTARSIVGLPTEMAKTLLVKRYALRFLLTLCILALLLLKTPVNPFAVMGGYTVILFGAIFTMVAMMGKDIAPVT